jgi:hypothetical protein
VLQCLELYRSAIHGVMESWSHGVMELWSVCVCGRVDVCCLLSGVSEPKTVMSKLFVLILTRPEFHVLDLQHIITDQLPLLCTTCKPYMYMN